MRLFAAVVFEFCALRRSGASTDVDGRERKTENGQKVERAKAKRGGGERERERKLGESDVSYE